jgi:hypothetical protein
MVWFCQGSDGSARSGSHPVNKMSGQFCDFMMIFSHIKTSKDFMVSKVVDGMEMGEMKKFKLYIMILFYPY